MKKMHFYNFILDFVLLVYFATYLMSLLWCMWAVMQESLYLGFPTKQTQSSLLSYRDWLENLNFACSKIRYYTVQKVNNKSAHQIA